MGKKQMLLLPKKDDAIVRSCRNLKFITTVFANSLNIVDVLKADSIIALKDSLPVIEKTYLKSK
jgi:ribosomal protein L4